MPLFNAYNDANDATHQSNTSQLSSQGYHPIALSVYGDPSSPMYAAVWVQEPAPLWLAIHGKTAAQYQDWMTNTVQAQGYSLRLVTAVGSGSGVVFAAVAEKTGALWAAKHDLTNGGTPDANSLQTFLDAQRKAGLMPVAIAIYGSPGSPLFAVACQGINPGVQWGYCGTPVDATQWQNCFNAYTRVPLRPGHFSISSDQQYIGVFRNDSLGLQAVRHGMTGSDYQAFVNQMKAQGNFPVIVAGAGSGSNTRYAAAFAKQTTPIARQWTATGNAVPYLSAIDTTVQNFMEGYAVRAGSVAIVRKGTLVYSRGFTFGEPGYAVTQPNSLLRIASCSKAFTCAAINSLVTASNLRLTDTVFPLLGITSVALSTQAADANVNSITVQNLIDHLGGWNDGGSAGVLYRKQGSGYVQVPSSGYDAVFQNRDVASKLNLPGPPTKRDVARFMYGQPLEFVPGTTMYSKQPDGSYIVSGSGAYSNFGYMLLGLVVEKVTGLPYVDYLRQQILAPLNLTDVSVSRMTAGPVWPLEVSYDEPNIGPTPFDWASNVLMPAAQGGEGLITEVCDSGGGLMTSAQTLATFAHTNAAWGIGGRSAPSARSGSEAGVSSFVQSRTDNIDWACIFNTRWSFDRVVGKDASGNDQGPAAKLLADIGNILGSAAWPS